MALNEVQTIDDRVRVKTALMSVWDKTGLDLLAPGLLAAIPEMKILSTGGTHSAIEKILGPAARGRLQQVSDYTGQPEMQGGLVKTLDFKVYLGLLSETYNPAHHADLARAAAALIDLVVVNLYPFTGVVSQPALSPEAARANIDIGGPCMVRAAAKNFHRVAALTDPADYQAVLSELNGNAGTLCLSTRWRLAQKAFAVTAAYDSAIAAYLARLEFAKVRGAYDVRAGS
jgi:phosphoribosylaminoimidazolecarboxamide formyltransferase / IMP cyclohydrolase